MVTQLLLSAYHKKGKRSILVFPKGYGSLRSIHGTWYLLKGIAKCYCGLYLLRQRMQPLFTAIPSAHGMIKLNGGHNRNISGLIHSATISLWKTCLA